MTVVNEDTAAIAAAGDVLHFPAADIDVVVEKLKTRQLFKFLKILTVGAGPLLAEISLNADSDPEEISQQIIALLIVSLPEAEDEVIEFMKSMVNPVGIIDPERSKDDHQKNVDAYTALYAMLDNPEPEDTLELLIKIVETEAPNMVALGKKLATLIPTVAKLTTSSKKPSKKRTPSDS